MVEAVRPQRALPSRRQRAVLRFASRPLRYRRCAEITHEVLDLGRVCRSGGQYGEQSADRIHRAGFSDHSRHGGFEFAFQIVGDLVGLDEREDLAFLDLIAGRNAPLGDRPLDHFYAPLGHRHCAQLAHGICL